jgi:Domain of unknown function (DU1801)
MDPMPVDAFLEGFPEHIRQTAQALRRVVRDALPDAVEAVRPGWALIGYDVPKGRRTAYVGFVWPELVHVHLGFQHGVLMADPDRLLLGSGRRVRWLTFEGPGDVRPRVLTPLVLEGARVATLPSVVRVAMLLDGSG